MHEREEKEKLEEVLESQDTETIEEVTAEAEVAEEAVVIEESDAVEEPEAVEESEVIEEVESTEEVETVDDDDEEGLEDLDESEILGEDDSLGAPPEKKAKKSIGMKILIAFAILVLIVGIAYLSGSAFFSKYFLYGTAIDQTDYSFKTVVNVQEDQTDIVSDYTLTLYAIDGEEFVINGSDIGLEYVATEEIAIIKESQGPFMWPNMFFETYEYTTTIIVDYDQDMLESVIDGLDCMVEENMIDPTDAYPEFQGTEYVIVSHTYGTVIDEDAFVAAVGEAVLAFQSEMNMEETECYALPEYTDASDEIIALTDALNQYVNATITYTEGSVLDEVTIASWLSIDEEFQITVSEDGITEFVSALADEYNTVGTTRTFTAADGATATVSGGTYGWTVDESGEIEQIKADLEAGEAVERTIDYSKTALSHGDYDWGDTYTEIDLTDQKVYYIKDGEVVVSGDIVTGDVDGGNATPQGVYPLSYKTTNAVLRGTQYADGSYEYESPVSYWMPFNGGIGMHDASWRSSFGGTIYKTNGSHGCINMSYSTAKSIYSYISAGDPIICHY